MLSKSLDIIFYRKVITDAMGGLVKNDLVSVIEAFLTRPNQRITASGVSTDYCEHAFSLLINDKHFLQIFESLLSLKKQHAV